MGCPLTISEVFRDLGDFTKEHRCCEAAVLVVQGLKNVAPSAKFGKDDLQRGRDLAGTSSRVVHQHHCAGEGALEHPCRNNVRAGALPITRVDVPHHNPITQGAGVSCRVGVGMSIRRPHKRHLLASLQDIPGRLASGYRRPQPVQAV